MAPMIENFMVKPGTVHQAMQDAPHDGEAFRQARAAIKAVIDRLSYMEPDDLARLFLIYKASKEPGGLRLASDPPA